MATARAALALFDGLKQGGQWLLDNLRFSDLRRNAERQLQLALPEVGAPEISVPEISVPEMGAQEISVPEISAPEMGVPEISALEMGAQEISVPEISAPEMGVPEISALEMGAQEVEISLSWDLGAKNGSLEVISDAPAGKIAQLKDDFSNLRADLGDRLYPAVLQFVDVFQAHMPQVAGILGGLNNAFALLVVVLAQAFGLAAELGSAIVDSWGIVGPLIWGAAAATLFFLGVTKGVELAQTLAAAAVWAYNTAVAFLSVGLGVLTGNTGAAAMAQAAFNSALMACPLTWLIMGFIAVVAIIYAVVGAINHFAGTAISATGLICGAIAAAGAFVANLFMAGLELILGVFATLYNVVAMVANFFGNVFNDPVAAIARLFFDLVDGILSLLQTLASAIDTIFGSKLADSVQGWRDKLGGWVDDKFGAEVEVMGKFNTADFLSDYRLEYGGAFEFGYDFGQNLADQFKLPSLEELYPDLSGYELGGKLDGIYENAQNTAGNTAAMANTLDSSDEDLQYLRDLAEREAINQFTTAEIVVDMGGITNQINKLDDLDGIVTRILDGVNEAVEIAAEGVHV